MNANLLPWVLTCIVCAGISVWGAIQSKRALHSILLTFEADQKLFGPKRNRALEKVRETVEWGEGHARMKLLIEEIRSGKGLWENPEIRRLAQEVHEASVRKDAELAAMTTTQRERAIEEWAEKLAGEELGFDDKEAM